jgi:SAM-dependent methyltransferase
MKLESVPCDLCNSNNRILLFKARDYRYGHSEIFNIVKCKECGLIYLNPRPTAESISELYKKDYTPDEEIDNFRAHRRAQKLKKLLRPYWYKLTGHYLVSDIEMRGRFLDIGCGVGNTLEIAREMGDEVYGIELNPKAVKICKDKGLNVYCGTLEDARYPNDYFDIIWMSQVIEHLLSPKNSLKEIRRILKLGGKLYIFCPNARSYLSKLFGRYWHGWHIPFHFYMFTKETITTMAIKCGFKIEKISYTTPDSWFNVSLKSMLYGEKDKRPIERLKVIDSLPFRVAISPLFRMLDLLFPSRGDCLKVVLTKEV